MSNPSDLRDDWPADPESDALAEFAKQLPEAVPALSAEALDRVEAGMQAEFEREERWRRRGRLALGWSIAAAVLVALGAYAHLRWFADDVVDGAPPPRELVRIEDRVSIAIGGGADAAKNQKPLVPLDDYRSLFED